MNNINAQQFGFANSPRPDRAEWERAIASLRPWLSPEKFAEAEKTHWRMFERANAWFEIGARTSSRTTLR